MRPHRNGDTSRSPKLVDRIAVTTPARYFAMIPSAGTGSRLRGALPKQYLSLAGLPMLRHVLDTFAAAPTIRQTFVVVSPDDGLIAPLLAQASHLQGRVTLLRCGGATRQETVRNGLMAIQHNVDLSINASDWVLVHDAARPGLDAALLDKLMTTVGDDPVGGLLALPIADTLKRGTGERVAHTVPRAGLWAAQTPQMFRFALLLRALHDATDVTDEASAIETLGLQPMLVEGSSRNFKVTLPDDIALATALLKGLS